VFELVRIVLSFDASSFCSSNVRLSSFGSFADQRMLIDGQNGHFLVVYEA